VLRHGDAALCDITLKIERDRVVLTVQNDGASTPASDRGSGLAGLNERLSAVGGTLEARPAGGGLFRVVAEVPLSASESVSEVTA
jgi:two-component system sensor histidine kinase DesK